MAKKISNLPERCGVTVLLVLLVLPCSVKSDLLNFWNFKTEVELSILQTILDLFGRGMDVTAIGAIVKGDEPTSTVKLIANQGYLSETHEVVTDDGYILEIHRIPYLGSRRKTPTNRLPVILLHGIGGSSATWALNNLPDDALAFHLADRGYDVWLANQRGNPYSTRHVSIDPIAVPLSPQFWDYSTHEVGMFDLPAIINYVLSKTNQSQVQFVGFGQGNAAFLTMNAKRPEYNAKIKSAVFLAPAFVYFSGVDEDFGRMMAASAVKVLEGFRGIFGSSPVVPPVLTKLFHWVAPLVCSPKVDLLGICLTVFKGQFGDDQGLISKEQVAAIGSVMPTPITLRTLTHIVQQVVEGQFQEYDFGVEKNREVYNGISYPPKYNLTRVTTPIAIMVGPGDTIGTPKDARMLAKKLPNLIEYQEINYPFFTHADFLFADGTGRLVYKHVVRILERFS